MARDGVQLSQLFVLSRTFHTKHRKLEAVDFLHDAENYPCLQGPYQSDRADTRDNSRAKFMYAGVDERE